MCVSRLFYETSAVCSLSSRGRARRRSVLFILGVAHFLASECRRRWVAPVDNECDFCKCWLPMYKCVYIFFYEHCSPDTTRSPTYLLSFSFPRFSLNPVPGVINWKDDGEREQKSLAIRSKHRVEVKKKGEGHPSFLLVGGSNVIKMREKEIDCKIISFVFSFLSLWPFYGD